MARGRESDAEQERSQQALERGGLPLAAQRRLRERAEAGGLFSSDLSVNEFALLHRLGVVPVTQVMGASIFQHGWQGLPYDTWYGMGGAGGLLGGGGGGLLAGGRRGNWGPGGDGRAWSQELEYISDAFNSARERALDRLRQEAELAGADAVVAVRIRETDRGLAGEGTIEFTAIGTAVRLPEHLRTGGVVITDLSGQDYVKLARDGTRPVGVVGITTVMYVASSYAQSRVLGSGNSVFSVAGRANQELGDFTRGLIAAREVAVQHLYRQARRLDAGGIVGVTMRQHIHQREYEDAAHNAHHDLVVYIHLLGTAITEGHEPLATTELKTVIPLRPTAPI